jgi:lipopolysaccharide export system protein LptC
MSELADIERVVKRVWAAPGGLHDSVIHFLKTALPIMVGLITAYMMLAPLTKSREISFILDKNKVEVAKERMRVTAARYQGQDNLGRQFTIQAQSAVQATSRDPVIDINGMAARISLSEGPATLNARQGRYDLEKETVDVIGPILFNAYDGYHFETRDVTINLGNRTLRSEGAVDGQTPLGRFSADHMTADLASRRITLTGRARLHIEQGGFR